MKSLFCSTTLFLIMAVMSLFSSISAAVDTSNLPPPPKGAKCVAHGNTKEPNGYVPLFKNETLLPYEADMDIAATCPDFAAQNLTTWGCCGRDQFLQMKSNFWELKSFIVGCEPCAQAIQNMFCWYTCSPYQANSNYIANLDKSTGQVLTMGYNLTQEYAERLWLTCKEASLLGVKSATLTQFLSQFTGQSPFVKRHGKSIHIESAPNVLPNCLGRGFDRNVTTGHCNHACSNPDYPKCNWVYPNCSAGGNHTTPIAPGSSARQNQKTYPLPRAKIGRIDAQDFVGILLGALVLLAAAVSYCNRDLSDEKEAEIIAASHHHISDSDSEKTDETDNSAGQESGASAGGGSGSGGSSAGYGTNSGSSSKEASAIRRQLAEPRVEDLA